MAKYGQVAERNNLHFIPATLFHAGQIHEVFKNFVKEQVRHKLIAFEGETKRSKIRSHMNWWVKCITAVIAKTASRNVAFKAGRMRNSFMEGQDEFIIIMRKLDNVEEVGLEEDYEEALADVGCNADLYVVNQMVSTDLFREAHTGQCKCNKLNREYTWGSSLKVSGEEESKNKWNFAKLTCLLLLLLCQHPKFRQCCG